VLGIAIGVQVPYAFTLFSTMPIISGSVLEVLPGVVANWILVGQYSRAKSRDTVTGGAVRRPVGETFAALQWNLQGTSGIPAAPCKKETASFRFQWRV